LRREVLHELTPGTRWLPSVLVSLAVGFGAMLLGPAAAALAFGVAALGWTVAATAALHNDWALPFIQVILASGLTAATLFGYRFGIADRDKRMMRRNFSYYLAPAVIDRMEERPPELGGEQRIVTIFFSDLANFTTLSEGVTPNELVA